MNWENSRSLTPLKKEFLLAFFQRDRDFYLSGGSALGIFFLDHRRSYDLDFFTPDRFDGRLLALRLQSVAEEIGARIETLQTSPEFLRFRLNRGDETELLDFVRETMPQAQPEKPLFGPVRVDVLADIGANKLCALLGRAEVKDLVDLYFLEKAGHPWESFWEAACQKDAGLEASTLSWVLSTMDLEDLPPLMIRPVSPEELTAYAAALRDRLAELSFPRGQAEGV